MDTPDILVLQASYTNAVHADAIGLLLNSYAEDPMGGGHSLPADLLQQLPAELAKRPHAFSVLAFVGGEPAGLVNCFEGFSTFASAVAARSPSKCWKVMPWRSRHTASSGLTTQCLIPPMGECCSGISRCNK